MLAKEDYLYLKTLKGTVIRIKKEACQRYQLSGTIPAITVKPRCQLFSIVKGELQYDGGPI